MLAFDLGMCEGVGEDSSHGIWHVEGSDPCRKLSLLGIAHHIEGSLFQVHGVYRRMKLTRGRVLEESRIVALVFILCNMY